MRSVDLRVQGLDSQWKPIQANAVGIVPQSLQVVADEAGPASMTLGLARNPRIPYDDLTAFTPSELRINGLFVWSGRIHETPVRDGASERGFTVSGKGWQFHADDAAERRAYVLTDLGAWRDQRIFPSASLSTYAATGQVDSEGGAVVLRFPNAAILGANTKVGVTLDLGTDNLAKRVVMEWEHSNNAGGINWAVVSHPSENEASGVTGTSGSITGGATGTSAGTFSTAYRYVTLYLVWPSGSPVTLNVDVFFRAKSIKVFTDTAYESGNASILKADTVIKDVRDRALPLLSSSNQSITAGTFSIPELGAPLEYKTPREIMQQAAAFEDYQLAVDVRRNLVFKPRPTTPTIAVGSWSGCEFEDASANSGEDIYNRVVVEATGPDDASLSASRFAAQSTPRIGAATAVTISNPGFETGGAPPSGWTNTIGTLAQDATTAAAGSNSGKFTTDITTTVFAYITLSNLTLGRPIVCKFQARRLAGWSSGSFTVGAIRQIPSGGIPYDGYVLKVNTDFTVGTWTPVAFTFMPRATTLFLAITGIGPVSTAIFNLDAFEFYDGRTSLVDRRNFTRTLVLQSGLNLTETAADTLAGVLINEHVRAQLRGTITVRGSAAREYQTGRSIPAHELLLRPGENVLLSHLRDPDTGAMGRVARIRQVTYDYDSDSASIEVDNNRGAWDALLARLGAITGQVR